MSNPTTADIAMHHVVEVRVVRGGASVDNSRSSWIEIRGTDKHGNSIEVTFFGGNGNLPKLVMDDAMKFNTQFSCGDKAWCVLGKNIAELTVGRVQVTYTASPGIEDEEMFHNYMAQSGYEEQYMCVETGIGTGNVYTAGKSIFHTKHMAEQALSDRRRTA